MTARSHQAGFTLIEVLLALAVITIALTALLLTTAQNISNTQRIKEKTISHWVAMQGVTMIQLNLIQLTPNSTQATKLFDKPWFWRATLLPTPVQKMKQLIISVSPVQSGPFRQELIAYVYTL
ncbi:MAG: GspI family T2SS minor pseudopilin variant LspI [Legionella sp.]|nr:GspI family T2SS minor pseudopilin variant LspI [Legionella sp.]